MTEAELHAFWQRLTETIAWCAPLATPERVNPALAKWAEEQRVVKWPVEWWPETLATLLRSPQLDAPSLTDAKSFAEQRAIVDQVASERVKLLREYGGYPKDVAPGLAAGRLLLHDPNGTDWSGGSFVASGGLLDVYDSPPWDTWITLIREEYPGPEWNVFVVAWIPPTLIDVVEEGIRCCAMPCTDWAENVDTAFTRTLCAAGIL